MDLSNAFDVLNHSLLLAKLDAHGFSLKSTTFIQSYLMKGCKKLMSITNSVHGKIFTVVCHRVLYLAHSSSIFSLMTFSVSGLLVKYVTTLTIILYILIAETSNKFKNI